MANWRRGWLPRMLLLLASLQIIAETSVSGQRLASRSDAFLGYSEVNQKKDGSTCEDKESACRGWKDAKQCVLNPNFMMNNCPKSCGICNGVDALARGRIPGFITPDDSKEFSVFYPAAASAPVAASSFRYDPSLGDLEQLVASFTSAGDGMRTRPWIMLSSLGVGTYLGGEDDKTDEDVLGAIVRSVAHGCNVIDTARNYRHGRAEASVGRALAFLQHHGVRRSSLFVSTKASFMPEGLTAKLLAQELVTAADLVSGHCMHPACIRASLEQSLAALHLNTVDLLYLHNPAEMQLAAVGKQRFLQRLAAAFQALEELRKDGKIQAYGLATWSCFRVAPGEPGYLSLQEVWDIAADVGGKGHGFRYVQLPINAEMRQAWQQPWQPLQPRDQQGKQLADRKAHMLPLTAAAAQLGVGVFASGPLGEAAVLRATGLMTKLRAAPAIASDSAITSDAVAALQVARSTPYVITAVVGHKDADHVVDNLKVIRSELLDRETFLDLMQDL